jgi:hypothetical protein
MKKIILLLALIISFSLISCDEKLNTSLYISSIGLEMKEDSLMMYFLCNPLTDITRTDNSELKTEYFKIKTNNISEGISKVKETIPFEINFMHLQTVIFHKNFIEAKKLSMFLNFMRDCRIITYNFYCFITEESMENIYEYESPDTISFQHSLLASPSTVDYYDFGVEGVHFLNLANNFYDTNRYLHLPIIAIKKTLNDKSVLTIAGLASIVDKVHFYLIEEYVAMHYLYEHDFIFYENQGKTYELRNYRFYHDLIDNKFTFIVRFTPLLATEKEKNALKASLETELRRFFDSYIKNEGGLYFIKNYNYLNKKALNAQKYEIIILIF